MKWYEHQGKQDNENKMMPSNEFMFIPVLMDLETKEIYTLDSFPTAEEASKFVESLDPNVHVYVACLYILTHMFAVAQDSAALS